MQPKGLAAVGPPVPVHPAVLRDLGRREPALPGAACVELGLEDPNLAQLLCLESADPDREIVPTLGSKEAVFSLEEAAPHKCRRQSRCCALMDA